MQSVNLSDNFLLFPLIRVDCRVTLKRCRPQVSKIRPVNHSSVGEANLTVIMVYINQLEQLTDHMLTNRISRNRDDRKSQRHRTRAGRMRKPRTNEHDRSRPITEEKSKQVDQN